MGESKKRREANPDTYGTPACPGAGYLPNITRQTGLTRWIDSGPSTIKGRVRNLVSDFMDRVRRG